MKRDIRLSKRAAKKLGSLLLYLEEEWSAKVKHDFIFDNRQSLDSLIEKQE